ncbi:MAG TPA: hypothetical protein V6C72_14430 [Chroococcales cyanobacterium]
MNQSVDYIQRFNQNLLGIFEAKAAEFVKHSQDNPITSAVTAELAGLYSDLAEIMKR